MKLTDPGAVATKTKHRRKETHLGDFMQTQPVRMCYPIKVDLDLLVKFLLKRCLCATRQEAVRLHAHSLVGLRTSAEETPKVS